MKREQISQPCTEKITLAAFNIIRERPQTVRAHNEMIRAPLNPSRARGKAFRAGKNRLVRGFGRSVRKENQCVRASKWLVQPCRRHPQGLKCSVRRHNYFVRGQKTYFIGWGERPREPKIETNDSSALRALNTIVRNTYKNNPTVLAEWVIASHVESRKAHHAAQPAPAPTPAKPA